MRSAPFQMLFPLAATLAGVPLATAAAAACRCPPRAPAAAFRMADAVVLVQVMAAEDIGQYRRIYRIDVKQGWKRRLDEPDRISTRRTGCMLDLAPGGVYLVYVTQPHGGIAEADACSGTLPAAQAAKALEWLNRNAAPLGD